MRVTSEDLVLIRPTILIDAAPPRASELRRLLEEPLTLPLGSMQRPIRVSQTPLALVSVTRDAVEDVTTYPARGRACTSAACDAVREDAARDSDYQAGLARERAEAAAKLALAAEGFTARAQLTRKKIASAVEAARAAMDATTRGRRRAREAGTTSNAQPRAQERLRTEQRAAFAARSRMRLQPPAAMPKRAGIVEGWQALPRKPRRPRRPRTWMYAACFGSCSMALAYWLTTSLLDSSAQAASGGSEPSVNNVVHRSVIGDRNPLVDGERPLTCDDEPAGLGRRDRGLNDGGRRSELGDGDQSDCDDGRALNGDRDNGSGSRTMMERRAREALDGNGSSDRGAGGSRGRIIMERRGLRDRGMNSGGGATTERRDRGAFDRNERTMSGSSERWMSGSSERWMSESSERGMSGSSERGSGSSERGATSRAERVSGERVRGVGGVQPLAASATLHCR